MKNPARPVSSSPSPWLGGTCVIALTGFCSLALQGILQSGSTSGQFLSQGLWARLVEFLGGQVFQGEAGFFEADVSLGRIFLLNLIVGVCCWLAGGWGISRRLRTHYTSALGTWGVRGWLWGLIPAGWELGRIFSPLVGDYATAFLLQTAPLWMASALAGWLATFATLIAKPQAEAPSAPPPRRRIPLALVLAVLTYVIVFTAMNWQLYRNLLVPHGDSAMYEEHLWNLTHGKGFRSYLEDRLFLGEHLQVVHVLLLPIYLIWPSLMTMDFCESLALAAGAFPVFWMTRRHTGSARAALLVVAGYLLYFPLQRVDIAIDLKTFRPIAFGIPAMLFGLDLLERGRHKTALICWAIALSAKEDYTLILAPLGIWIAIFQPAIQKTLRENNSPGKGFLSPYRMRWLGIGLAVFSTVYLLLAVKYIIPWFRSGAEVHYVGYFSQFGDSLGEVVRNILGNPRLLLAELFAVTTPVYAAALLISLGAMALFSPSRLLVALPLFGILCLNQIDRSPHHHFHAPLVPILWWATAAGVAKFPRVFRFRFIKSVTPATENILGSWAASFVFASALSTGLFFSMSPAGVGFWDPDSAMHWQKRYVRSERAQKFPLVLEQIPQGARVFSTDFVHPRFTHYARSYDYSDYERETDKELTNPVPGETYYIVIDTRHPYSTIRTPADIPEYRQHPEDWELLPDKTDGYFIVLRRREPDSD